jgi:hypothetical protein
MLTAHHVISFLARGATLSAGVLAIRVYQAT